MDTINFRPGLTDMGFDRWFEDRAGEAPQPGLGIARITAVDRGAFHVRDHSGEATAELAGKFRFAVQSSADLPCVGDWAWVARPAVNGPAIIHGVLPRKTFLRRKCPGPTVDYQMIAANIDAAFIIQACRCDLSLPRLERYLVMVNEGRIEPCIVLGKTDLVPPEELERTIGQIRRAGIAARVLALSNQTGAGLDELRTLLVPGKTYCLLGSSGVGKTTLINRLLGREAFVTHAVSGTGEGVHTTARRHLLVLEGGALLVDTPGMRELGLVGTDDGMAGAFADVGDAAMRCRFADCTHIHEPGCAVLAAVRDGAISADRYNSYLKLKKESDHYGMSYVERRKKDRAFGKFIKSAKKQTRRDG